MASRAAAGGGSAQLTRSRLTASCCTVHTVCALLQLQWFRSLYYDHIQPITAIATRAPDVLYDPADVVSTWTDVTTTAVQRAVAGWGCSAADKHSTVLEGGCVPLVSARVGGCSRG